MLPAMALYQTTTRVIFKAPPPNLPLDKGEESYGALVGIDLTKQPKICIQRHGWVSHPRSNRYNRHGITAW